MEQANGAVQAGIMLRKPFGGVCVYDSSKLTKDRLLQLGRGTETNISFDMVEDQAIAKMPPVLVPHHAMDVAKN
jgi:hypothetical protein